MGSDSVSSRVMSWPVTALVVSTSGVSAVTVISSVCEETGSANLRLVVWPERTRILSFFTLLKPGSSAVTTYWAEGSRLTSCASPWESVTAVRRRGDVGRGGGDRRAGQAAAVGRFHDDDDRPRGHDLCGDDVGCDEDCEAAQQQYTLHSLVTLQ